ncbi:MAG: patatin-like phospholipase family protein [Pseudomonadota bacterium]
MAHLKADHLKLNLALQGGGAHGAYTWGVLDALLEVDALEIDTISGTSAGAVNAVALASGLARGGPEHAREALRSVWSAIVEAGRRDRTPLNPIAAGLKGMEMLSGGQMSRLAGAWSPYEFNPLDINPLRMLLEAEVDFSAVQSSGLKLAIAATDIETGMARVFETHEVTLDVVLASACLPAVSRAVEIEGRHYWDGGFSANPDLLSFARISETQDTLLVLVSPLRQSGVPRAPQDIAGAIARITFNQPLLRDLWLIDAVRQSRGLKWRAASQMEKLARQRFHLIDGGPHTEALSPDSKIIPDVRVVDALFAAGASDAAAWLDHSAEHVGWRETADFAGLFESEMAREGAA